MTTFSEIYLANINDRFEFYKKLGEGTFTQLADDHFFRTLEKDGNSIATLIKHISGNMRSRFIDFLTADGEKEWRNRDSEFENDRESVAELLVKWEEGWSVLFEALDTIDANNFEQAVYIRKERHHIIEALNRQLAHYAYHIGQIVTLGKWQLGDDWTSLSIPKGESEQFNKDMFNR